MAGKNKNVGTQLSLNLTGQKKKSFPPAEVMRRALGIKAAKEKRIAEQKKAESLDAMYKVLHRAGLNSSATTGNILARIKALKNEIAYHGNQISMNNTSGDIHEAREHEVIKEEKEKIAGELQKLVNSRKKI